MLFVIVFVVFAADKDWLTGDYEGGGVGGGGGETGRESVFVYFYLCYVELSNCPFFGTTATALTA